jgi:hypothetical protein
MITLEVIVFCIAERKTVPGHCTCFFFWLFFTYWAIPTQPLFYRRCVLFLLYVYFLGVLLLILFTVGALFTAAWFFSVGTRNVSFLYLLEYICFFASTVLCFYFLGCLYLCDLPVGWLLEWELIESSNECPFFRDGFNLVSYLTDKLITLQKIQFLRKPKNKMLNVPINTVVDVHFGLSTSAYYSAIQVICVPTCILY